MSVVMKSKLFVVTCIVIAIAVRTIIVQGLQCYVCDDCNEYEDFKELQICGEISGITTQRPSMTNPVTMVNVSVTTLKPSGPGDIDDYSYEYNMDSQDGTGVTNNKQKGDNNRTATTVVGTTILTTLNTQTTNGINMTTMPTTGPTTLPAGNTETTTSLISVTTLKPGQQPADYDYMEYEDPKMVNVNSLTRAAAGGSLLKVNEPVCYMFRYHANNTIYTKRGCTTSINDNTFLTCQSLYSGQPISGCRICNTDGCNRYAYDESGEDHIYNAGVIKHHSIVVVSILAVINAIILV